MCGFWRKYRALCCENWLFWIYLVGIYSCINHRTNFTIKLVLTSCQKMGSTILFLINLEGIYNVC